MPSESPERHRARIIAIWMSGIFLGVLVVLAQVGENAVRRAGEQTFRAEQARLRAEDLDALNYVASRYREGRSADLIMPLRDEALAILPQTGATQPATSSIERLLYTDPKTGAQVKLHIIGAHWQSYSSIPRTARPPQQPWLITTLRRLLLLGAIVAWLLILRFRPPYQPHRQVWAHLMLVLASLAVLAASLDPPKNMANWLPPLTLFGLTAIPVSIGLLVLSYRKPKLDHPACRNCGYNLTGNTSGICPECGAATSPVQPA